MDLQHNLLTQISNDMFRKNTNLFSLILTNNNINSIQSRAFSHMNITHFDITNNNLSGTIQKDNLTGIFVRHLDISRGQLITIETEAFTSMSATLQILDLNSNHVDSISRNAFDSLENLDILDVSNNSICEVNLQMNELKRLTTLNISRNFLKIIFKNTLQNVTTLIQLDLSHNYITEIEPGAFIG